MAGVCFIVYPWIERYLQEQQQLELLTKWEHVQADKISTNSQTVASLTHSFRESKSPDVSTSIPLEIDGQKMMGTIEIDKIALREPMLEGSTEQSLKLGVGTVEPERQPGELGNFVLAGHRSWTHGRQFSRLDELDDGDEIFITTNSHTYTYAVTSKFLVTPDDLSVLDEDEHSSELTLITCEPAYNPTHRLIVKAELKTNFVN